MRDREQYLVQQELVQLINRPYIWALQSIQVQVEVQVH